MSNVWESLRRWSPSLALLAGLAAAGCDVADAVTYLDVDPSVRDGRDFVSDLGELPAGASAEVSVEFWNVGDRAWRMSFDALDSPGVSFRCDQEYDCGYVGPSRHSEWTAIVPAGVPGQASVLDVGVILVDADTGEQIEYANLRLLWRACGEGGASCG
ncbi:hypothetical protein L6R50_16085 [Myxococcota bacterium]|nr:hypothetical protein [Myxococcota bacterium]